MQNPNAANLAVLEKSYLSVPLVASCAIPSPRMNPVKLVRLFVSRGLVDKERL